MWRERPGLSIIDGYNGLKGGSSFSENKKALGPR